MGYIIANKDDILEATSLLRYVGTNVAEDGTNLNSVPTLGLYEVLDDTRAFFDRFGGDVEVGDLAINVELWVEGQYREPIETWKNRPSEDTLTAT